MENDVLYNRIMNVVHEEYGSGSTAVANPTGEPTDSLETIQIGDDVYSIDGGGGGGVLIIRPETTATTQDLKVSFNDLKDAFYNGENIFIEWEVENGGATGTVACPFEITAIIIFETVPYYMISFSTTDASGNDITVSNLEIEDPDADIVRTIG